MIFFLNFKKSCLYVYFFLICSNVWSRTDNYFIVPQNEQQSRYRNAEPVQFVATSVTQEQPNIQTLEVLNHTKKSDTTKEVSKKNLENIQSRIQSIYLLQNQRTQLHNNFLQTKAEISARENSITFLNSQLQLLNQKEEGFKKENNGSALENLTKQKLILNQQIEILEKQKQVSMTQNALYLDALRKTETPQWRPLQELQREYQKHAEAIQEHQTENSTLVENKEDKDLVHVVSKPILEKKEESIKDSQSTVITPSKSKDVSLPVKELTLKAEDQKKPIPIVIPKREYLQKTNPNTSQAAAMSLPVTGIFSGSFSRLRKKTEQLAPNHQIQPVIVSAVPVHSDIYLRPQKTIIPVRIKQKANTPMYSNIPQAVFLKENKQKTEPVISPSQVANTPTEILEVKRAETVKALLSPVQIKKPEDQSPMIYMTYRGEKVKETKHLGLDHVFEAPQIMMTQLEKEQDQQNGKEEKEESIIFSPPLLTMNYQ